MLKFVDVKKDLCGSCANAFKGGCPIWPTIELTVNCIEYKNKILNPRTRSECKIR
jgi:hypothetical protein